jgi:hypothetical protein
VERCYNVSLSPNLLIVMVRSSLLYSLIIRPKPSHEVYIITQVACVNRKGR